MAYVKLAPFAAVFLLVTFSMFPMNKGDNPDCTGACSPFEVPPCRDLNCRCIPVGLFVGFCIHPTLTGAPAVKMVEEHPNLCQTHADCMKKGTGSFCARYPNPDIEYGWCFASNTAAEAFFKIAFNSEAKAFLKMPAAIATK